MSQLYVTGLTTPSLQNFPLWFLFHEAFVLYILPHFHSSTSTSYPHVDIHSWSFFFFSLCTIFVGTINQFMGFNAKYMVTHLYKFLHQKPKYFVPDTWIQLSTWHIDLVSSPSFPAEQNVPIIIFLLKTYSYWLQQICIICKLKLKTQNSIKYNYFYFIKL